MARNPVLGALLSAFHFGFCLFNFFIYIGMALSSGLAFRSGTEKDKNDFLIARDKLWNLNKSPLPGFKHYFFRLKSGFKFHFLSNKAAGSSAASDSSAASEQPLLILIHGFPDSAFMWKHLLQEPSFPLNQATVVAVDLPGYGGTDNFKLSDTAVLEALTEFILGVRAIFTKTQSKVYIVAHDWGAVLSLRLAAEAPGLADRFILINGPHAQLAYANRDKYLTATVEAYHKFASSPSWENRGHLVTAINSFRPLLRQVFLFGYQYAFRLPAPLVKFLGTGGYYAFVRGAAIEKYGRRDLSELHEAEELALVLGPGVNEVTPQTNGPTEINAYGKAVQERAKSEATAWYIMTSYYRDGCGWDDWNKTPEILALLRAVDPKTPATTAEATAFGGGLKGALHAPLTMLWGLDDLACSIPICLDGIDAFLAPNSNSEVTILPRAGHWLAVEKGSRATIASLLALYATGGDAAVPSVTKAVEATYPGATLKAKR